MTRMIVSFHGIGIYDCLLIFSALVILCIAIARLNDIKRTQNSKRWYLRRIGLLMILAAMTMFIASYFTVTAPYWDPTRKLLMMWGFMVTWITTPQQPPFWKYISRNDPQGG